MAEKNEKKWLAYHAEPKDSAWESSDLMGILLSKTQIKLIFTDDLVNWLFLRNVNPAIPWSVISSSGALPDQFSI